MGLLTVTLAAVAATIGGGTYQGKVDAPCDSTCIARLVVVDDGRSLTTRSFVGAPCDFAETTTADSKPAPRGTPVRANGSFRWKTRYQVVSGKFAADGKSVGGPHRYPGGGPAGGFAVDVRAINVSCGATESVARAWTNSSRCLSHSCTAAGWHCGRPHGDPERSRCRRGHAAVDLRQDPIIFDGPDD